MKNKVFLIILISIVLFNVFPLCASERPSAVVDVPEILTDAEFYNLYDRIDSIRNTYGVDIAFVISKKIVMENAQSEADNLYDYYGYGVGENYDGILYLVCSTTHEYAFTTCGKAIEIFNDDALEYIDNEMLPYLKDGDYYNASLVYVDKCEELLKMAENGEIYKKKINILYVIGGIILIPLALAFALMSYKLSKMNTATFNYGAADYVKNGSMNLQLSRDIFLYSTVSKTEKQKSNSTTHTSSSGRPHGGRGGS
ncbi:MAG: TPM domain-containing protein, partial [Lachnospirales bacterium]